MNLSRQPVTLDANTPDQEGLLVFREGRLLAVLSCLGDIHTDLQGHWFIEATFGTMPKQSPLTFETIAHFEEWLSSSG